MRIKLKAINIGMCIDPTYKKTVWMFGKCYAVFCTEQGIDQYCTAYTMIGRMRDVNI